ncbi:MAG: PolC-type DNA polymerase III [Verrucomicrobiota bacterium]
MIEMLRARDAEIVAVDFECTGTVKGYANEPWQIGMVVLERGKINIRRKFSKFLRVGERPFSPYAPGRYAEFKKQIQKAPRLEELWPELKKWWLDKPLAAHSVGTEKKFIRKAAPMHSFGVWIDTLKLVRKAYPKLKSYKLEDVLARLDLMNRVCDLCPGLLPHDALFDAIGAAAILEHLLNLKKWENVSIESLVKI